MSPQAQIYQIKITLQDISPPIWRRIQVRGDTALDFVTRSSWAVGSYQAVFSPINRSYHLLQSRDTSFGRGTPYNDSAEMFQSAFEYFTVTAFTDEGN